MSCDFSLEGDPLSVTLLELTDYHNRFVIMLILLIALEAVDLLVLSVSSLINGLEADVNRLQVAVAVAQLHLF
jgi:hypothetical protein